MRRIAIVGGARFGIGEPYAGGLEAHTADLARGLTARGYAVTVYAGRGGADPAVPLWPDWRPAEHSRSDMSVDPHEVLGEHMAYQRTMLLLGELAREGHLDHVHLNSCHHLPVAMAPFLGVPVTATLHSPPTDWLAAAYDQAWRASEAPVPVSVSAHLAAEYDGQAGWRPSVIENGVDPAVWTAGQGAGGYATWCGRIVAEKAPGLAIDAARAAGLPIVLAGPAHDADFFAAEISPRLGPDCTYVGHLSRPRLVTLLGNAEVALVTPTWPEPFGLTAVEALACGTPVAATRLGALPDIVNDEVGAVADPTVDALAEAMTRARAKDRGAARRLVQHRFSLDRMIDDYEALFQQTSDVTLTPVA